MVGSLLPDSSADKMSAPRLPMAISPDLSQHLSTMNPSPSPTTLLSLLCATHILCPISPAQDSADIAEKYAAHESKQGSFKYRVRPPDKVEPGKKYPLVLLLHGAGGRGDDNRGQIVDASGGAALDKMGVSGNYGAYVMAGQVPLNEQWVDVPWSSTDHEMPKISKSMRPMLKALDAFIADKNNQVDPQRIYVIGLSMGGYGTWDAIQRRPKLFAAAVPICGGGDKRLAKRIARFRSGHGMATRMASSNLAAPGTWSPR